MKLIGYIIAGVGVLIIAFNKFIISLPLISGLGSKSMMYTIVAGVAAVAVGVVLVLGESSSSDNVKHAAPEVPIYEGTGKNRRIVGYQRAK